MDWLSDVTIELRFFLRMAKLSGWIFADIFASYGLALIAISGSVSSLHVGVHSTEVNLHFTHRNSATLNESGEVDLNRHKVILTLIIHWLGPPFEAVGLMNSTLGSVDSTLGLVDSILGSEFGSLAVIG